MRTHIPNSLELNKEQIFFRLFKLKCTYNCSGNKKRTDYIDRKRIDNVATYISFTFFSLKFYMAVHTHTIRITLKWFNKKIINVQYTCNSLFLELLNIIFHF